MNRIKTAYDSLRHLQLYMTVLNIVNRNIIFANKVLRVGLCIVSGYAGIAHFKDHPVFGMTYYIIFLDCALVYCIIYAKAFRIPLLVQKTSMSVGVLGSRLSNRAERSLVRKWLKSIPPLGIQVGSFHTLERTSTPVFLHHVLVNVVNMLVA